MIESISKITGFTPVKYLKLTEDQRLTSCYVKTDFLENFSKEEFTRVLWCDEIKEKISEGYNYIIEQQVMYKSLVDFLELPETDHYAETCVFTDKDTGQPCYKTGIKMVKYFLQLRLVKI